MKVTLKKSHTHDGKTIGPGLADLPAHDALWLKAQDLVEESADAIVAELKRASTTIHDGLLAKAKAVDAAAKSAISKETKA